MTFVTFRRASARRLGHLHPGRVDSITFFPLQLDVATQWQFDAAQVGLCKPSPTRRKSTSPQTKLTTNPTCFEPNTFHVTFKVLLKKLKKYVPYEKNLELSQNSKVRHCDISKCHKMSQNITRFSILRTKVRLPFTFGFRSDRL